MERERRQDFCTSCREWTVYEVRTLAEKEIIKGKEYEFTFTKAFCTACGAEMSVPGLIDINIKERDEQYREAEGLISVNDIRKLMDIYHIGKAPLSIALGFGEITISRYLDGQMPSKAYSNVIKEALSSPEYMETLLNQNREKVGETAYKKAMKAIAELKGMFKISEKMLVSIAYIFEQMQEVTPLALQKILYYIEGIYMVLFDRVLFDENCCAWQHGPVYEEVYYLFKDFKYNPIDDDRFVLFRGKSGNLSYDEKQVIDLVIKTMGNYSGKVLETITHNEKPWLNAREGYNVNQRSNVIISKDEIYLYFKAIDQKYNISTVEGINQYIHSQLQGIY